MREFTLLQGSDGLPDLGGVALFDLDVKIDGLGMTDGLTPTEGDPADDLNLLTDLASRQFSPTGPSASSQRDILARDGNNNLSDFSRHIADWGRLG